jgi:small subunit ribosomal protein S8
MTIQDPIADMLTRIRNAQARGIEQVRLPYSNVKREILRVLKEEGFVGDFEEIKFDNKRDLQVNLRYYQGRQVIEKIKRISRPGLRSYKGHKDLKPVRGGLGITILSTPKGVMTDKSARTQGVGGEILCTVE